MFLYWQTWISLGYVRSSPRHWDREPAKGLVREEGRDAFIDISQGRTHPRASPENGAMLFDLVPIFVKKKQNQKTKTAQPTEMGLQSKSLIYKPS